METVCAMEGPTETAPAVAMTGMCGRRMGARTRVTAADTGRVFLQASRAAAPPPTLLGRIVSGVRMGGMARCVKIPALAAEATLLVKSVFAYRGGAVMVVVSDAPPRRHMGSATDRGLVARMDCVPARTPTTVPRATAHHQFAPRTLRSRLATRLQVSASVRVAELVQTVYCARRDILAQTVEHSAAVTTTAAATSQLVRVFVSPIKSMDSGVAPRAVCALTVT